MNKSKILYSILAILISAFMFVYAGVDNISYHENLSRDIGRKQFNFTSGNFSEASDDDLRRFIIQTNGLNQ